MNNTIEFDEINIVGTNLEMDESKPFLMHFLEPNRLYSLSQASTTSCPASTGPGGVGEMTPDD